MLGNSRHAWDPRDGLGEEAAAGTPLDGGFPAEEVPDDGVLWFQDRGVEGDSQGVAEGGVDAVLAPVVFSLGSRWPGTGGDVGEELCGPFLEGGLGGARRDHCDVGLGVDGGCIGRDGDVVEVFVGEGDGRGAEASMEGDGVGSLDGEGGGGLVEDLGLAGHGVRDLLVEFMCCDPRSDINRHESKGEATYECI